MATFQPIKFDAPDFLGYLQAAQGYQANRMKLQQLQDEQMRAQQFRQHAATFLSSPEGSPERQQAELDLVRADPRAYADLQQSLIQQRNAQQDYEKNQPEIDLVATKRARTLIDLVGKNPSFYPAAKQEAEQSGLLDHLLGPGTVLPDEYNPDTIAALNEQLTLREASLASGLEKPQQVKSFDPSASARDFFAQRNIWTVPEAQAYLEDPARQKELESYLAQRSKEAAPKSAITLGVDSQGNLRAPLSKGAETKIQQDLLDTQEIAANLKELKDVNPRDFLGFWPDVKYSVGRFLDYFGAAPKSHQDFVEKKRSFNEVVEQSFLAFAKSMTGASRTLKELEDLRNSMLNKDLGPSEYSASLRRYQKAIDRRLRLYSRAIAEGVNVGSPKDLARAMDSYIGSGATGKRPEDINARDAQLQRDGITDRDQRYRIIVNEGYLDE